MMRSREESPPPKCTWRASKCWAWRFGLVTAPRARGNVFLDAELKMLSHRFRCAALRSTSRSLCLLLLFRCSWVATFPSFKIPIWMSFTTVMAEALKHLGQPWIDFSVTAQLQPRCLYSDGGLFTSAYNSNSSKFVIQNLSLSLQYVPNIYSEIISSYIML